MTTILVIESDHVIAEELLLILQFEGYDVILADSGDKALTSLRSTESLPELIVLDIQTSPVDTPFYEALVEATRRLSIPIPIVPIAPQSGKNITLKQLGFSEYVQKPLSVYDLLVIINNRLKRLKTLGPTMNFDNYLSQRAQRVRGSLGKQTSVPIEGLINLGSGTPDFAPPAHIFDAMRDAINAGRAQYTAWTGIPELRKAIADKLRRENAISVDPNTEILVTSGAQEALMVTLMTLLDPGDNALTPSPHYDEYTRDANILGSTLIPVATRPETNFTISAADLEAAITPQTKAFVIVSPNNPTGTVLSESVLRDIAQLAQARDLLVISDEIYERYVFDDNRHVSMASLPGMRDRTITINSFSKSYAMTGLRLGYIAAPAELIAAMLPFHHAMMICAPVVSQYGGVAALTQSQDWFKPILAEYDRRRHVWMQALDDMGLPYSKPQGAYYIFIDIRPTGLTSAEFVGKAREEARLVFQPGTIGGGAGEGFIRGALTTPSPKFEEGLDRLKAFVKTLKVTA